MRTNRVVKWLALALLWTGLAGAGETIRLVGGNTAWGETMKLLIPDFERETGVKVVSEMYGEDQLQQKLSVEFATGASDLDVFMTRPPQEAKMMHRNGWYADLFDFMRGDAEYDIEDFTAGAIQATRLDGVQTSIPILNECHVLYYRKDLFEAAGLKPPATFAELEAAAAKLTNRRDDFAGFISRGQRSPLITQFSSYLYAFGGDFFDAKTMTATVNTPEALGAIEFYGRMVRLYGPSGALNMSWPQGVAVFQQGKGAMYLDSSSQYRLLLDPKASAVADKTGVAVFPAGPKAHKMYDSTGWALAIYSKAPNRAAAWKFVRWMTDKKRTVVFQGEYSNPCARKSAYADPAGVKSFPPDWVDAVKKTASLGVGYDRPLVTAVSQARDIIGSAVVASIEGQDYQSAAAKANSEFQALLDKESGR